MDFENRTPFLAKLSSGSTSDAEMVGIAVCKVTMQVEGEKLVAVPADQAWPIFEKPFVFEGVAFGSEFDYLKERCDLLVFGKARAPHRRPVRQLRVAIHCGTVRWEAEVFGDRHWERTPSGLVASSPATFTEMELTNDRAYGGPTVLNGDPLVHHINPVGKGFHLDESCAAGKPLPNIESPSELIQRFNDVVTPVCLYKPTGPLGLPDPSMDADGKPNPLDVLMPLMKSMPHQTVPSLVAAPADLGSTIQLTGFTEDGRWDCPLPACRGPELEVAVGERTSRFSSELATVIVLVDQRVLIVTYRCLFRYLFAPQERRRAALTWGFGDAIKLPSSPTVTHA
jgi:hypothetical protein